MLTKPFLISGGLIFVALGLVHTVLTALETQQARSLSPVDPVLHQAMTTARLRLHGDLRMWDAWLGFNFSHSIGLILFGAVVLITSIRPTQPAFLLQYSAAFTLVGAIYTALAIRFWFWVPATGTAIGTALLALSCFELARS